MFLKYILISILKICNKKGKSFTNKNLNDFNLRQGHNKIILILHVLLNQ